jgi:hypothetical protein
MIISEDRLLKLIDKYNFVADSLTKALINSSDLDPCILIPIEECKKIKSHGYDCIKCRIEYFEKQYKLRKL